MHSRQNSQSTSPFRIRHNNIRRVENKNEPAHVLVNITPKRDQARSVKNFGRDRTLFRTITTEIEPFRGRVGKYTVIGVIEVWEFDPRVHLHRQERRSEERRVGKEGRCGWERSDG